MFASKKGGAFMAEPFCPKCGTRRVAGGAKRCADCRRDASERRLLAFALVVPFVLALAVVVTGLPL